LASRCAEGSCLYGKPICCVDCDKPDPEQCAEYCESAKKPLCVAVRENEEGTEK